MDYHFTAKVEKSFDDVAEGEMEWQQMIQNFYKGFHPAVEKALAFSSKASGERLIGVEPKTGENVYAKLGKYGPMVQIGENYENEKPRYARLKKSQSIENITLDEALDLFKLPRVVGAYEGEDLIIGIGRFGPYLKYKNSFISIPKTEDPLEISYEKCLDLMEEKKRQDKEREPRVLGLYKDKELALMVGKYGPYLKYDGKNVTLGKGVQYNELTLQGAIDIVENGKERNVLRAFPENSDIKVMNGRYGAYIVSVKDNYKIPKGHLPENLTYQDCLNIIPSSPTGKRGETSKSKKII